MGVPTSEAFREFDFIPLGSTSIEEVHQAVTRDGREVAVKVQYGKAQELFHEDIEIIHRLSEVLALDRSA